VKGLLLALAAIAVLGATTLAVLACWGYARSPALVAAALAQAGAALDPATFGEDRVRMLLAVEDPAFERHNGIDLTTPGAGYTTITQGLVKGLFYGEGFTPGPFRYRKITQTVLAWSFNRRVAKETQLRLLLNTAYLGTAGGKEVHGFAEAARVYFGRDIGALSDDEYLALVAMLVGPDGFSVRDHPDRNAERVARIKKLLAGGCHPRGLNDVYYEDCAAGA